MIMAERNVQVGNGIAGPGIYDSSIRSTARAEKNSHEGIILQAV